MAFDIRLQLEINVFWERNHPPTPRRNNQGPRRNRVAIPQRVYPGINNNAIHLPRGELEAPLAQEESDDDDNSNEEVRDSDEDDDDSLSLSETDDDSDDDDDSSPDGSGAAGPFFDSPGRRHYPDDDFDDDDQDNGYDDNRSPPLIVEVELHQHRNTRINSEQDYIIDCIDRMRSSFKYFMTRLLSRKVKRVPFYTHGTDLMRIAP